MGGNNRLAAILLCLSGCLLPLAAQETTGMYFIRQSEMGEQLIVQRLFWPEDENASRYEVEVERENADGFAGIHRESTESGYIDISLGPGSYRYRVRFFNLLNQVEYTTNWALFNIILALQPVIETYTPETLYIHEDSVREIRLTGSNLVEDAQVFLVSTASPENPPIAPRQYTPSGETALLAFDPGDLRPGAYRIVITNPGGLEAAAGFVYISSFRPPDIALSAGYAPLLPLYGYLFDAFDTFAPLGMDLRGSFVFLKYRWGYWGVEADLQMNYLRTNKNNADVSAFISGGSVSLLYKKSLFRNMVVLGARLGAGISAAPLHLEFDYGSLTTDPLTSLIPAGLFGVSLEWRFTPFFYSELGVDYVHLFSRDTPQPGFFRPFLNAGLRFSLNPKRQR
ncbi:MAG: hypothetical protein LBJ24_00225 [Treponema sp.]|jgi:hypothetical protein|nr:hypothetical protein [Treponema sp.]